MDNLSTITQSLAWATNQLRATSDTPRLDAELLLAFALGWDRARLLAEGRMPLTAEHQALLHELVRRRVALEPVAYLTGHKEFYGLDFSVDQRVLVPRPETELLVELALDFARQRTQDERRTATDRAALGVRHSSFVVADIGTGSAAIAIALAMHLPTARIVAIDISQAALVVARRNVERHGVVDRVQLIEGDLLEPLHEPVDLLVSNPPYTILSEIDEGVRRHEPQRALDGGPDGLAIYRRLLAAMPAKLSPDGAALLEIGATQGAAVPELAHEYFPEALIRVYKDLAGHDRVVVIENQATRS